MDISFTPGFSPVSNDDKKGETVLTVSSSGHNTEAVDYVEAKSAAAQGNRCNGFRICCQADTGLKPGVNERWYFGLLSQLLFRSSVELKRRCANLYSFYQSYFLARMLKA